MQISREKEHGRPIEFDLVFEGAAGTFLGRKRPRLGSWRCASSRRRYLALLMTPSLSAVWVCAVCVEDALISTLAVGKTGCGSYNFTSLEDGAWQRSRTKRAICGAATECHENVRFHRNNPVNACICKIGELLALGQLV